MKQVIVAGPFDDLRYGDFRFLHAASQLGAVHARVWSDRAIQTATGKMPRFPQMEREYFLNSIRYVDQISVVDGHPGPALGSDAKIWAALDTHANDADRSLAASRGVEYRVIRSDTLQPSNATAASQIEPRGSGKRVIVTGCYDWFHTGHVRFCEECSELGDLYVVVGHDENIRLLKGERHPVFPAEERRFIVGSIKFVTQSLISTGHGWMDAEPEIVKIKPDIYAVNEDGDKPEKRAFCEKHGIEYRVLKRLPKQGLPRRSSTDLRGF